MKISYEKFFAYENSHANSVAVKMHWIEREEKKMRLTSSKRSNSRESEEALQPLISTPAPPTNLSARPKRWEGGNAQRLQCHRGKSFPTNQSTHLTSLMTLITRLIECIHRKKQSLNCFHGNSLNVISNAWDGVCSVLKARFNEFIICIGDLR